MYLILSKHTFISLQLFIEGAEQKQHCKEFILSGRKKGVRGGTHEDFSRPLYL